MRKNHDGNSSILVAVAINVSRSLKTCHSETMSMSLQAAVCLYSGGW